MRAGLARTILFVEDDAEFARDLLAMWAPAHRVHRAASGEEALEMFGQGAPDLVLLDLCLPHALAEVDEEEGLQLLTHVRRELRWSVPIVVVTRDTSPETRRRAFSRGADAFLQKPVDVSELDRIVNRLLLPEAASG